MAKTSSSSVHGTETMMLNERRKVQTKKKKPDSDFCTEPSFKIMCVGLSQPNDALSGIFRIHVEGEN